MNSVHNLLCGLLLSFVTKDKTVLPAAGKNFSTLGSLPDLSGRYTNQLGLLPDLSGRHANELGCFNPVNLLP